VIVAESGKQFDPSVVHAYLGIPDAPLARLREAVS
jgi:hypothetical protein